MFACIACASCALLSSVLCCCRAAGVFSPGNPASFQANFMAGQQLLERLEAMAGSRAAVERLRGSTAAAGWAKRWNLPVYFSLVFQDIAGALMLCFAAGVKHLLMSRSPSIACTFVCYWRVIHLVSGGAVCYGLLSVC
jgi:hypothetical protein